VFAPVGSPIYNTVNAFPFTPGNIGDFIVLEVVCESSVVSCTGLTSGSVTWRTLVPATLSNGNYCTVFIGVVTSTAADTGNLTFTGTQPVINFTGMEFSTTAGYGAVSLDSFGVMPATSTNAFPALTPHTVNELYFGYAYCLGFASAGSTPGFTYSVDVSSNGACWNAACANATQTPVWANTSGWGGLAVMLYEASVPGGSVGGISGGGPATVQGSWHVISPAVQTVNQGTAYIGSGG